MNNSIPDFNELKSSLEFCITVMSGDNEYYLFIYMTKITHFTFRKSDGVIILNNCLYFQINSFFSTWF